MADEPEIKTHDHQWGSKLEIVSLIKADEGLLAEHDLCTHATLGCVLNLGGGVAGNCVIAEAFYNLNLLHDTVTAVFECPLYVGPEDPVA